MAESASSDVAIPLAKLAFTVSTPRQRAGTASKFPIAPRAESVCTPKPRADGRFDRALPPKHGACAARLPATTGAFGTDRSKPSAQHASGHALVELVEPLAHGRADRVVHPPPPIAAMRLAHQERLLDQRIEPGRNDVRADRGVAARRGRLGDVETAGRRCE